MKTTTLIIALAFLSYVYPMTTQQLWTNFKLDHAKTYSNRLEEEIRFKIFTENLETIKQLAAEDDSAEYGITQYADLTTAEFESLYTSEHNHESFNTASPSGDASKLFLQADPPASVDWRAKGFVTAPKEQMFCMASWSFAVVGAVESHYAIKHNKTLNLSEQMVIDCNVANGRCFGSNGTTGRAYQWLADNGGLETAADYPYFGVDLPCAMDKNAQIVKLSGYKNVSQDEKEIARVIATEGPVSAAINVRGLQFYKRGVLKPKKCDVNMLNYHVVLVGYGTDPKQGDYWIGKNSMGTRWGEQGFFRIFRGAGTCGINKNVQLPIVL